jgi:transcriptional regulator with XRE-family HTH domain
MQVPANDREFRSSIGSRVRDARKKIGLTQKEFATRAGLHHNAISAIESGSSKHPKHQTLARIADALSVSVEELEGTAPATPPASIAVVSFLEGFRMRSPESFANWPEQWKEVMWGRFTEIGAKMGITTDYGAHFFAERVTKEFNCVRQFLDLCDWNHADSVVALLSTEHARLNPSHSAPLGTRVDFPHNLPEPHTANAYAG